MKIKVFSAREIQKAVTMAQAIAAMKDVFAELSRGEVEIPLRTHLSVEEKSGITLFMPAYVPKTGFLGAKIVSVFPENWKKSLPTIHAIVALIDAETGKPEAIFEGTYLTALRTGAASGLATDLLARKDAAVASIFGAGAQARTQLEAVCTVRPIAKVWVYDPVRQRAEAFAKEMKSRGQPIPSAVMVAGSPSSALREADVVCTVTTSKTPVFNDSDLKKGVHINAIGAFTPETREIPGETVARAKVFVDSLSAALSEAGDLIIPLKEGLIQESHFQGEIGALAAGLVPGRQSDKEITLFKSVGIAAQDIAVASVTFRAAARLGLGKELEI